nr:MAG TPA: hypothetical protein [Caudoviricetes sp.]
MWSKNFVVWKRKGGGVRNKGIFVVGWVELPQSICKLFTG